MAEKWFQLSERGAGEKRLLLSYWAYKILGAGALRFIAFFVSLSVFFTAKERREASFKFYKLIKKPPFISALRQFLNYGDALVDKFISFAGDFDNNKFWNWVRQFSRLGYKIFVSEYSAPEDFKCIWAKEKKDGMALSNFGAKQNLKIEKLFCYAKEF